MWNALDGGGASSDYANFFVCQFVEIAAAVTAGVRIIPAACVKGVTFERVDAGDAGKFWST